MASRPVASSKFDPSAFVVDDCHAFGGKWEFDVLHIEERSLGSKFFLKFIVTCFESRVYVEIV
jgi:hypothetical protein